MDLTRNAINEYLRNQRGDYQDAQCAPVLWRGYKPKNEGACDVDVITVYHGLLFRLLGFLRLASGFIVVVWGLIRVGCAFVDDHVLRGLSCGLSKGNYLVSTGGAA